MGGGGVAERRCGDGPAGEGMQRRGGRRSYRQAREQGRASSHGTRSTPLLPLSRSLHRCINGEGARQAKGSMCCTSVTGCHPSPFDPPRCSWCLAHGRFKRLKKQKKKKKNKFCCALCHSLAQGKEQNGEDSHKEVSSGKKEGKNEVITSPAGVLHASSVCLIAFQKI